jgi:hypothetical protein
VRQTVPRISRRKTRKAARQSAAVPGYDGRLEIGARTVEDPYDPGNTISVPANIRHDPLMRMAARQEIDTAQMKAGEALRECHEAASTHGLKAIDPSLVVVDGGRTHQGVSDIAIRAARRLREAEALLGWQAYRIVVSVVCEGIHGSMIAQQTSANVNRNIVQHQVRAALEQLAILWGFASDPRRVRQRASMVGLLQERARWIHDEKDLIIRYRDDSTET